PPAWRYRQRASVPHLSPPLRPRGWRGEVSREMSPCSWRHARAATEVARTKSATTAGCRAGKRCVAHQPRQSGADLRRRADCSDTEVAGHACAFGEMAILQVELGEGFRMLGDEGDGDDDDANPVLGGAADFGVRRRLEPGERADAALVADDAVEV